MTLSSTNVTDRVALDTVTPRPRSTTPPPGPRSAEFDEEMNRLAQRSLRIMSDGNVGDEEYVRRMQDLDREREEALRRWKDDPSLSADQKKMVAAEQKNLDYLKEHKRVNDEYRANPNDPAVKARYEAQQAEQKEFRRLIETDPAFKDNAHVKNLANLEQQLETARGNAEAERSIKAQMNREIRAFQQDMLNDPNGVDKIVAFANRNQNNAVVRNSGLADMVHIVEEQRRAAGTSRAPTAAETLRTQPGTPSGPDRPGAVTYKDEQNRPVTVTQRDNQQIATRDGNPLAVGTRVTAETVSPNGGAPARATYEVVNAQGEIRLQQTPAGPGNGAAASR